MFSKSLKIGYYISKKGSLHIERNRACSLFLKVMNLFVFFCKINPHILIHINCTYMAVLSNNIIIKTYCHKICVFCL